MAYPVKRSLSKVTAFYRTPERPTHGGIDIAPLVPGTLLDVYSVGAGVIVIADKTAGPAGDTSGLDVGVRLDGDGSTWWYGHLSHVGVSKGQRVKDGQWLGRMGATGSTASGGKTAFGVHLHLERHWPRLNAETDPWPYIKDEPDVDGVKTKTLKEGPFMALSDNEQSELLRLMRELWRIHIVPDTAFPYDAVILAELRALRASQATGNPVDADDLVKAIAAAIPDDLAEQVADELAKRLAA